MNDRCYYSRLYAICLTMACFSLAISCKSLPRAVGSDVADRIKITRDRLQTEIAATHSHPPLQELWNQAYISFDKANREGFRRPVCAGACVEVRGFASADNGTIRPCANGTFPLTNVCYSGTFGLGLNYQFDRNGSNFVARIGTSTNGLAITGDIIVNPTIYVSVIWLEPYPTITGITFVANGEISKEYALDDKDIADNLRTLNIHGVMFDATPVKWEPIKFAEDIENFWHPTNHVMVAVSDINGERSEFVKCQYSLPALEYFASKGETMLSPPESTRSRTSRYKHYNELLEFFQQQLQPMSKNYR